MDAKRAIQSLLYPRSIAVVGASEAADKFSGRVLKHLLKSRFKGAIFPVNPKRSEVQGVPCFARVRDIAVPVNVAVMVVPNRYLFDSLEDCREKGVDVALVLNSGFAEAGEEGKRLQEKLTLFAEETGIRVCGPNSNGYVNILEKVVVGTSGAFDRPDFIAGNVAFLVQSGGIAGALLDLAQEKRIGLSYCISLGNEADLGATDFVDYLADDPHTQVIAMFVEGLRDGRRFLSAAERAIEKGKSLVVFKVGKSLKGQEAARAHTGKLAGSVQVWSEALRRAGVGEVADLDDLVGASGLLSRFPSPKGKNLAILTLSGGQGVILADLCESHSVHLPPPSPEAAKELKELLPDFAAFSNPIDLTGQASASPEVLDRVLAKLAEDSTFDVLLLVMVASPVAARLWTERIVSVAQKIPRPLIVLWSGGRGLDSWRDRLQESGVPVFTQASVCVRALSAFLSAGKTAEKTVKTVSLDRNRAGRAQEFLRARRGMGIAEPEAKELARLYRIPVPKEWLARSEEEAAGLALSLGGPVALKVISPDILHRSDSGLVRLGISQPEGVAAAFRDLMTRASALYPRDSIRGILVQEMVHGGTEVLAGVSNDPQFGPVVLFGSGGISAELVGDVSMRLCPLSQQDCYRMISETKIGQMLSGYRGLPQGDLERLSEVLMRLSELGEELSDFVREMDINPLVVMEEGHGVVAIDVRLITTP